MDEPFYLVWNETTSYTRVKHVTLESARDEAKRMSRLHPGQRFHVLTSYGYAVKDDVRWEHIIPDTEIPF